MLARDEIAKQFYIEDHAVIFGLLLRQAEKICGEAGNAASVKGTILYARERGLRMAMRCHADGKPLTPQNYLDYGEWTDDRGWSTFVVPTIEPQYTVEAHNCGWYNSWKKHGLEKYGKVYCTWIDKELVKGFNPENSLGVDSVITLGDNICVFRYLGATYKNREEFDRIVAARAALQPRTLKDFLFHTGHVLSALRRTYLVELGLTNALAIVDGALAEYAEKFGREKTAALVEEARRDYLAV